MEQLRQHKTAKSLLVAALAIALAIAVIFAFIPLATLTAHADTVKNVTATSFSSQYESAYGFVSAVLVDEVNNNATYVFPIHPATGETALSSGTTYTLADMDGGNCLWHDDLMNAGQFSTVSFTWTKTDGGVESVVVDATDSNGDTFHITYSDKTNKITYHLNGGEWEDGISAPTLFKEGEVFNLYASWITPVKSGRSFDGWYTSDTLNEEIYEIPADVTNDIEVWAKWSVESTEDEVSPTAGKTEHEGEVVTVTASVNEEGNGFVLDGTHPITITFAEGFFPDSPSFIEVADGYELDPGSGAEPITVSWGEVSQGGYGDPTGDHRGFFMEAPNPLDLDAFDGTITINISDSTKSLVFTQILVYGHYIRTVKYNVAGGTMPDGYATKYLEGKGLALAVPTNNAYTFQGWYDNEELEGNPVTEITSEDEGNKEFWASWVKCIDLATLSGNYVAQDGEVLTGTLGGNYKISIADGATVTLKDVIIIGKDDTAYSWAGITLEGDGTLILKGSNTVKGFNDKYPGIYVPTGKTLVIDGEGSLDASPTTEGWAAGIGAGAYSDCGNIWIKNGNITVTGGKDGGAGIGGANTSACGNITIEGGTINAKGVRAAAIGGAFGACGDISISGGTLTLTGGFNAAAIGSGLNGTCGNITITDTVSKLTATKDSDCCIGAGKNGTCGTITIARKVFENGITKSPFVFPLLHKVTLHLDGGEVGEGNVTQYAEGFGVTLPTDVTKDNYTFAGWFDNQTLEGEAVTEVTEDDTSDKEYWAKWELVAIVDLSAINGDYTLLNGQTATGTLNGNYKISVADGAEVILDNVTINGGNSSDHQWAGLTLLGNGTIVLVNENVVNSFNENYPGIFVGEGYTLTIKGNGSLEANGTGYGAGIGGGTFDIVGGNIVIEDGTIVANGGENGGAGIGSGASGKCGDITIKGGKVTATGGSLSAAIGSGAQDGAVCGDITIEDTVLAVRATVGNNSPESIGAGKNATCGTVTVCGVVGAVTERNYVLSNIAAEDVRAIIEGIGTVEYTEECRKQIDKARDYYDTLSDAEKAKIDAETLKKLEDAEAAYKDMEDGAKADETIDEIGQLPAIDQLTIDDKETVLHARAAYDALTDDQKKKVNPETLKKLTDAEKEITDIEKATEVADIIDALPDPADGITTANKDVIQAARAAYDALTDDQKKKVDPTVYEKLQAAETAYATATITENLDKLPASVDDITKADKETINAARAAYDALSDEMKGKIPQEVKDKLLAAEDKYDTLVVTPVINAINALRAATEITPDDQADVSAARAEYEALTQAQKDKVSKETLDKLIEAENVLKEYNAKVAKPVADTIDALPDTITADDKDAVQAAREAYETLTREQKACVPQETRDKLLAAEKALRNQSLIGCRWYLGYSYDIDGAYFKSNYGTKHLSNHTLRSISSSNDWLFTFESAHGEQGGYSEVYWNFTITEGSTPTGLEVISGSGTEEDPYVFAPVYDPAPSYVSVDAMKVVKGYTVDFAVNRVVPVKAVFNPASATDKSVRWSVQGDGVVLYSDKECTTPIDNGMTSYTTVYAKGVKLGSVVITAESLDIVGIKGCLETEVVVDQNIGMTWFLHYEHEITADRFEYRGGSGLYDIDGYELIVIEPYRHMDGYYQFVFEKDGWHENFTIYMDGETRVPTGLRITGGAGVYSDPYYIEPIYEEPPYAAVEGISLSQTELEAYTGQVFVITASFDPKFATDRQVIWSADDGVELYVDKGLTTLVGEGATDVLSVFLKGVKVGQSVVTVTSIQNSAATATMNVTVLDGTRVAFVDYVLYSHYSAWHGDKLILREVGSTEPFATLTLTESGNAKNTLYLPANKYYELVWYGSEDAEYCGFQFINTSTADRLCYVADCGEFEDGQVVATFYVTNRVIVRIDLDNDSLTIAEGEAGSVVPEVNPGKVEDTTMTWSLNKSGYIELYADRDCTTPLSAVIDSRSSVYVKGIKSGIATITFTSVQNPYKHAYCVVTVSGAESTETIQLTLEDSAADGWNGAYLILRDPESGEDIEYLSPTFGTSSETKEMNLPFGTYDLYWESGYNDQECSFIVTIGDVTINSADFTLQNGLLTTLTLGTDEDYANVAIKLIETLNAVDDLTYDDNAEVEAVRKAYEGLDETQKKLIGKDFTDKLDSIEAKMTDLVAAHNAEENIVDLPDVEDLTISDKEDVQAARKAYDALTDEQKAKVANEILDKLTAAEEKIAAIEKEIQDTAAAKQVSDSIDELKVIEELTIDDKEAVENARKAFNALTDDQKAKVSKETLDKLAAAEKAIAAAKAAADNKAAAQAVIDKIDALGATPTEDEVKAARSSYNDLTPDQRELVTNLSTLTAAEKAIVAAKAAAASQKPGLSGGAIAGIVISFVIVLAVIGLLIYSIINDNKQRQQ